MRAKRISFTMGAAIVLFVALASTGVAQPRDPTYRTFRPAGGGPHPAVIFASGCDGFAPSLAPTLYERRAEAFRAQGNVVVFADYLGRRSLKTCAGPITHKDAARDVVAAAAWLASQPEVDAARIAAIGWSYGGRVVLEALVEHTAGPVGFSRAVAFYPDCRALSPWKATLPVLLLLGGDDDMTPARLCQDAVTRLAAPTAVKVVLYPGALHGFDVPEARTKVRIGFGTVGYHPEAAASAEKEVQQFLRASR
jgi:dienelactone hydrolase